MNGQIFGGGAGAIKSIQRGTITLGAVVTNTATITAVVLANSIIRMLGLDHQTDNGVAANAVETYLELTNTTMVTATRSAATDTIRINYEVIEYHPGFLKNVQRGLITLTAAVTNTATVTSVDTSKAQCDHLGNLSNDANAGEFSGRSRTKLELTNATTVTASRGIGTNNCTVSYQLVEYYQ